MSEPGYLTTGWCGHPEDECVSDDKRIEELLKRLQRTLSRDGNTVAVLRRELLPLLLAGQAMRDKWPFGAVAYQGRDSKEPDAWDAALSGSEESKDGK
jgi:hypothetical protein